MRGGNRDQDRDVTFRNASQPVRQVDFAQRPCCERLSREFLHFGQRHLLVGFVLQFECLSIIGNAPGSSGKKGYAARLIVRYEGQGLLRTKFGKPEVDENAVLLRFTQRFNPH